MKLAFCASVLFALCAAAGAQTTYAPPGVTDSTLVTPDGSGGVYFVGRYQGLSSQSLVWGDMTSLGHFTPAASYSTVSRTNLKQRVVNVAITSTQGLIYAVEIVDFTSSWYLWQLNPSTGASAVQGPFSFSPGAPTAIVADQSGNLYVSLAGSGTTTIDKFPAAFGVPVSSSNGTTEVAIAAAGSTMATYGYITNGAYYTMYGGTPTLFDTWPAGDTALIGGAANDPAITYMFATSTWTNVVPAQPIVIAVNPAGAFVATNNTFFPPTGYVGSPTPSWHENGGAIAAILQSNGIYRVCSPCLGPTYDWDVFEAYYSPSGGWLSNQVANALPVGTSAHCTLAAIDTLYDYYAAQNPMANVGEVYRVPAGTYPGLSTYGVQNVTGTNAPLTFSPYQLVAGGAPSNAVFMSESTNATAQPNPLTTNYICVY